MEFPKTGRTWDELQGEMIERRKDDLDWQHGRHSAYVWYANDEVEEVASRAYSMFITTNGLGKIVFPSIRTMEEEVIAMMLDLFNGEGGAGHMTSGGTESIFLAVKAARDWARQRNPALDRPEIVAPFSAHPALNKAAHYLGMEVVRVPTGPDFRADVAAMAEAVTRNTVMLYGSAPAFSMGIIDPIADLGVLAGERDLWLHVDACVGGVLGPFVRKAGYPVPVFDFSLPGVSSISADLHKSGFAAKGASTLTFRDQELQAFSRYDFEDWPSGLYSSLTFTGTNPGGAIAAAWAVMNFLGEEGYLDIARTTMKAREEFEEGLAGIDGIHIWGKPDLYAVAYGSEAYDILAVTHGMWKRGWMVAPNSQPPGIHFMITPVHAPVIQAYLAALEEAVSEVKAGHKPAEAVKPRYA
ncbi:MAG: aspartate aminotransferase family protein [Desulfobacterales bacterium]|nr:aspartate aminotransferase family protein [Desulfobacterales bacterium]